MYKPIEIYVEGKAKHAMQIGRKVLCRNLYLEAFDHRISEVQMHPLFGIGGVREKIMKALIQKKEGYLEEITIDMRHIKEFSSWLQTQIEEVSGMGQDPSMVAIHEKLMHISLNVHKYESELELQKTFLENLSF